MSSTDAAPEPLATIPSHPCICSNGSALSITLDFTSHPSDFWIGDPFVPYRANLLSSLPLYLTSRKCLIKLTITNPHHRTQSITLRAVQRDLVNRVVGVLKRFEVAEVEVLYQSPETNWSQLQTLAPFWGLRGKWGVWVKEADGVWRKVVVGGDLGVKLQGCWRGMRERRELY